MLISGKAYWTQVLGKPRPNKFKEGNGQWSFDLSVDESTQKTLLEAGMKKSYLRNKDDERGVFLTFQRDSIKVDGTPGKPFEVIDAQGNPWNEARLIGNGSTLNVIVSLNERSFRGEKFLKPSAIKLQVWELSEYKRSGGDGFPTKEDAGLPSDTESKEVW